MQAFLQLISGLNETVYLKLEIPDIVFFEKGEPK